MSILQINDNDGRHYVHESDPHRKWKSVSYLCGLYEPKEGLAAWRRSLPPGEADRIFKQSAITGTAVHGALEAHFSPTKASTLNSEEKIIYEHFKPVLEAAVSPVYIEQKLLWVNKITFTGKYSRMGKLVGFGGTSDANFMLNGKSFIKPDGAPIFAGKHSVTLDWKIKRSTPKQEYLLKYYLQLAAYTAAFNWSNNCEFKVNKGLIAAATSEDLFLYYLPPKAMNFYWAQFKRLLYAYYTGGTFDWVVFKKAAKGYMADEVTIVF